MSYILFAAFGETSPQRGEDVGITNFAKVLVETSPQRGEDNLFRFILV